MLLSGFKYKNILSFSISFKFKKRKKKRRATCAPQKNQKRFCFSKSKIFLMICKYKILVTMESQKPLHGFSGTVSVSRVLVIQHTFSWKSEKAS